MTVTHATHTDNSSVGDVRRTVLMARIGSTQPESVDHLLQLADVALRNVEVSR